ncbi:PTS sugar transporter subunit IIB [Bacillus coagulans]|mgnify:CR=1 FL=1|uniref:PTS system, cellobiose-specific IIB component n=1 Tax=Heyndrickxia coagulans TaxID=1398 RepID=A0A150KFV4_HEYCO|nr:PTS sugar transporter subunit IIB [Heyndrickxia coagulans]KYC67840.1 PTS system, cellobiose-specific IIB component [Heyndrickxia coagulans]NCG67465.1 PTS sugar transporter subunit IIB [Heyndrickxia coagulans]
MNTIMLVCAAGMSTSLLVTKMQRAAKEKGVDADIFAVSAGEVDSVLEKKNVDVLLLGPQVKFMKEKFEKSLSNKQMAIDSINMQYYGTMNGEKVLEQVLSLINKNS